MSSPMVHPDTDHPTTRLAAARHDEHLVGFYDSEAFLTESVLRFLEPGLAADEPAVVIATAAHGAQLEAALGAGGHPVERLRARGQLRLVDAEHLLARVLVGGMPDRARFQEAMAELIDDALRGGRPVRAFGEMVALLWAAGNVAGVLALEDLWNELLSTRRVSLFCAYPMGAFDREETEAAFHEVCDAHTVVLPSERYSDLPEADDRSRAVAVLQHEAVVGINERIALRQVLHQREAELQRLRALDRLRERLVDVLAPLPASAPGERAGQGTGGMEGLHKTACRQVRSVLGAVGCTFVPSGSAVDDEAAGGQIAVPLAGRDALHGQLRVELPPERHLDDDELRFLHAVAATLAAGLSAHPG